MQTIRGRPLLVSVLPAVLTAAITVAVILSSAPPSRAATTDLLPPSLVQQIHANILDGNTLPVHPVSGDAATG